MPRYRLTIEYDGTAFVGWQRQENGPSVQAAVETALLALTGETLTIFGAGRTDAGVHALGQVAHFDLSKSWQSDKLRDGLNFHLKPARIAVLDADAVEDAFDARFSAIRRHYLYRIVNRRSPLALDRERAWRVTRPLDEEAMNAAAQTVLGKHDFTTFRSVNCQANSALRTLDALTVERIGDVLEIRALARSFLHNQVRSLVGSLKLVGDGRWPVAEMRAVLDAKDRARCGAVAPAHGLYFTKVDY